MSDGDWRNWAACKGIRNPDIFFPSPTEEGKEAAAKMICASCPVQPECLDHHLRVESGTAAFGIAGGMTEGERRAYLRKRSRARRRAKTSV